MKGFLEAFITALKLFYCAMYFLMFSFIKSEYLYWDQKDNYFNRNYDTSECENLKFESGFIPTPNC